MRLPDSRYEEIINAAADVFFKNDIRAIPIDIFEIAAKMHIILKPYSSLTEEALIKAKEMSEDGFACSKLEKIGPFETMQWYIFYDDTKPSGRIRFTVMHEIGHIVFDHTEGSDLAEAEANFFAKYSLALRRLSTRFNRKITLILQTDLDFLSNVPHIQ